MTTAVYTPLSERINLRVVAFIAVIALLVGIPVYKFIDTLLAGGRWDRGSYTEVDLKWLSSFEMDQVGATNDSIPRDRASLDGKRVMLVGEMVGRTAIGQQSDFDLVYSIAKCCFTGQPKIQHFVKSNVTPGKRIASYSGLVKVIGTLHVGVERDGTQVLSVFRLDVEAVEPA